jgi:hypothetical protein
MGNNPAAVGINNQMQFSPATPGLYAMLLLRPLAGATDLSPVLSTSA